MIFKSFLVFISLSVFYAFIIDTFALKGASQNQNQDNLIKAQNYLFEDFDNASNVIVGTSLSCHLTMDSLVDFYNLSFNGSSIYDGLNIILKSDNKPKVVYIESNFYLKDLSGVFDEQLFSFYSFYSSKFFPIVRYKNQPIGIFNTLFDDFGYLVVQKHNLLTEKIRYKFNGKAQNTQNDKLFEDVLKNYTQEYQEKPVQNELDFYLLKIKYFVEKLKKMKVKVIFFEMPINTKLVNLNRPKLLRAALKNKFQNERFLPFDSTFRYQTSDGLHLKNEESVAYTRFFKNNIIK
jgi:hypothetical protein